MRLAGKPMDEIEYADVEALVEDKTAEGLDLEYKGCLPSKDQQDRKEFLKDVSSFANKLGGIIIYGIKEDREKGKGLPSEICGIGDENVDDTKLRLAAVIRKGLTPTLSHFRFKELTSGESTVLLLGISRSISAPHMVGHGEERFWVRTASGKNKMHVSEIRRAFLEAEDWGKRADRFRTERVIDVWHNEIIPGLRRTPGLFFHLLPVGERTPIVDFRAANRSMAVLADTIYVSPQASYHADGIRRWSGVDGCDRYLHLFRDGGIEYFLSAEVTALQHNYQPVDVLDGTDVEVMCARLLNGVNVFAEVCDLEGPFQFLISIEGCQGWHLHGMGVPHRENNKFDRDEIMLPPILIEHLPIDIESVLSTSMAYLWQASGMPDSPLRGRFRSEMLGSLPSRGDLLSSTT